ncbi:hypothetical protein THUN1379_24910 [Paludibacterium sp. THUN1379]|uniref:hypothetical protein n=1 Tax=Paludibacterium sp. THUN1379 TaxID=3112107 RepID=UPI0030857731|nr:hypothetical protein THUN1379_24910 [Paludibacterium sp. THUN1379]
MNHDQFLMIAAQEEHQMVNAVGQGAQWEIIAHWFLCNSLSQQGCQVIREFNYQAVAGQRTDIAFLHGNNLYYVETKVESATNAGIFAGRSFNQAFQEDYNKLYDLNLSTRAAEMNRQPGKKWILFIAYSDFGKNNLYSSYKFMSFYQHPHLPHQPPPMLFALAEVD